MLATFIVKAKDGHEQIFVKVASKISKMMGFGMSNLFKSFVRVKNIFCAKIIDSFVDSKIKGLISRFKCFGFCCLILEMILLLEIR